MTVTERQREQQRIWRQQHPGYQGRYYAEHRDAFREYSRRSRERARHKPCLVAGCQQPRYVTPGGYVDARCRQHEADHSRQRYWAKRGQQPPVRRVAGRPLLPCAHGRDNPHDPCSRPRWLRPTGQLDASCQQHSPDYSALLRRLDKLGISLAHFSELLTGQASRCACCAKRRPNSLLAWRYDFERDALLDQSCARLVNHLLGRYQDEAGGMTAATARSMRRVECLLTLVMRVPRESVRATAWARWAARRRSPAWRSWWLTTASSGRPSVKTCGTRCGSHPRRAASA